MVTFEQIIDENKIVINAKGAAADIFKSHGHSTQVKKYIKENIIK